MPECDRTVSIDEMCEADQALPDGNIEYDINNCHPYDVFKHDMGKQIFSVSYKHNGLK